MKSKLLLIALFMTAVKSSWGQVDFPVYKPLPPVPRQSIPTPIPQLQPQYRQRSYEESEKEMKVIAKFVIENATIDGKDYSKYYRDNQACLVIYTQADSKEIYFATYIPVTKSISTGIMTNLDLRSEAATSNSYKTQTSKFKWFFSNSYDNVKGTADVHLLKIYTENDTAFSCTISSKDTFLKFTGRMEDPN
ncbi:hypothetical protein [Pedobacter rhizosphaerae]|uniref:Ig-like domain-containing protein n=1 Tax=Pedobacter rhizosphaerae TaxID=390241 RepID=A0A1H9UAY1_9SPHI|nr:hypothetical protein [Pedobacter rhizosphaerae]SES06408.1 hypothetical protein SAMN04488023_1298 [Pedobacter rhizosphaerae]